MKKYRIQLDFSEDAFRELEKLVSTLGAPSHAEVIRNALGVFRWVTEHLIEGDKILVQQKNSRPTEVEFPFLRR